MGESHPYILGTGDEELDRLADQHHIWLATTNNLWDNAGFGPGDRIVDLGCGPGFTSFDLAERVGAEGQVIAIDNSERFVSQLQAWCRQRSIINIEPRLGDAYAPGLDADSADGVFMRWLLCFLPDTEKIIREATRILAPGGRLVVWDYFHYQSIELFPKSKIFRTVFDKVYDSFAAAGGDLDVAGKLPPLMHEAGLEVTQIELICETARPGAPVWHWVRAFQKSYLPQLVTRGILSQAELDDFDKDWLAHQEDPNSFFFSPPMLGVIGRRSD